MPDCTTCAAYLGAGQCRDHLEAECREGGGYEAHRRKIIFGSLHALAEYAEAHCIPEGGFCAHRMPDGRYELEERRNA